MGQNGRQTLTHDHCQLWRTPEDPVIGSSMRRILLNRRDFFQDDRRCQCHFSTISEVGGGTHGINDEYTGWHTIICEPARGNCSLLCLLMAGLCHGHGPRTVGCGLALKIAMLYGLTKSLPAAESWTARHAWECPRHRTRSSATYHSGCPVRLGGSTENR